MTRETKFGLLFVCVLTGVFGMLVYKRLHQPADLVAGINETDDTVTAEGNGTDDSATTPENPLLATGSTTAKSDQPNADPFDKLSPVKPSAPARPDAKHSGSATVTDLDFTPPDNSSKPKLPTSIPDDDFFTPPATTTAARSASTPSQESDPFATDFAATPAAQPAPTTAAEPFPRELAENPSENNNSNSDFDPFSDPPLEKSATAPVAMESPVEGADPFGNAPALTPAPKTESAAASPATSSPVEDDPFMVPATTTVVKSSPEPSDAPALDFAESTNPQPTNTAPVSTTAPALDFDTPPMPSKSVTKLAETEPAPAADDPFRSESEIKVTTKAATPVPTEINDFSVAAEKTPRPALPTEIPETDLAFPPTSPVKPEGTPADLPDLEPQPVATTVPEMTETIGTLPAKIEEPDPFAIPNRESEFPAARPIPALTPATSTVPAASRLASNTGTYEVQLTDSFWTISKQVYGTGRYYQALARHNAAIVSDPQKLKPGTIVQTPAVDVLETRYRAEIPLTAVAASSSQDNDLDPGFFVDSEGRAMYRVGSNDTLSSISKAHLGRASRWIQIFEMNRQTLKDGNTLKVGTVLQLPADASQVQVVEFQQLGR